MSTTLKFIHKNIDCLKELPRSGKALREHEVNIDPQFIRQKVWNSDPPCYVHYHRDLLQLIQEFLLDPVLFEDLSFNGMGYGSEQQDRIVRKPILSHPSFDRRKDNLALFL
ncbi:MAG: hypothetical protein LW878_11105 [Proteobacteria bacterium]|nr:hypothetical protein [Pseudomonadota bacterium]